MYVPKIILKIRQVLLELLLKCQGSLFFETQCTCLSYVVFLINGLEFWPHFSWDMVCVLYTHRIFVAGNRTVTFCCV